MYDKVTQLEIELTSKCNAACPQCSRNYYGGITWPTLPIVDLPFTLIKEKLGDAIKNIDHVRLCGTYGEPCLHPEFLHIVKWILENSSASITINTNGSLRKPEWWKQLAEILSSRGKVYFGIDGLKDTHHLYRRRTSFKKIISNAQAFNQAGGTSVWSFLIFEHNQHQINQARELSKQYGFTDFAVKTTSRFLNKAHRLLDKQPVYNRNNKIVYWISPTTHDSYVNNGYSTIKNVDSDYLEYLKTVSISCVAKKIGLVTVSAEGFVVPCGWLQDRFYGYEVENVGTDRQQLFDTINKNGGMKSIDLNYTDFNDIINGPVFQAIEHSWKSANRLERCANQCGNHNNLTVSAIKDLQRTWDGKNHVV